MFETVGLVVEYDSCVASCVAASFIDRADGRWLMDGAAAERMNLRT